MPFLKNLQFTHLIKINGHLKEFNFRKSNANAETVIAVDTSDGKHKRICFNMHRVDNEWKIIQTNLPAWVLQHESCLNDVILKELASREIYMAIPAHNTQWQLSRLLHAIGFN